MSSWIKQHLQYAEEIAGYLKDVGFDDDESHGKQSILSLPQDHERNSLTDWLLDPAITADQRGNRMLSIRSALTWRHHGYNVFELTPDFTAAMLLTDADAIDTLDNLALPFETFAISLPAGFFVNSVHTLMFQRVTINGSLNLWFTNFTDTIVRPVEGMVNYCREISTFADSDLTDDQLRKKQTCQAFLLCIKSIAYISAVPSAIEKHHPKKQRHKRVISNPNITRYTIGRSVTLNPQLIRECRAGLASKDQFHIQHRFIVRGHFRNQPCGPGRQERKRIWVAPFWKGPEEGARIIHTYKPAVPVQ